MCNEEIIINVALANNLYTEEEIEEFLEDQGTLPLHTFAIWKKLGYSVRKGEHGIETRLWKPKNRKEEAEEKKEITDKNKFILTKAYLFDKKQVEKLNAERNNTNKALRKNKISGKEKKNVRR